MIVFFTTANHRYAVNGLIRSSHRKADIRVRSYDWLARQRSFSASACIFTDFDRLRSFELSFASGMYRQMRDAGIRVLNDPAYLCQRHELLHRLHAIGFNGFRSYLATHDPRPSRFPVFFKHAQGHSQEFEQLIGSQAALDEAIAKARDNGAPMTDLLVIEFANEPVRQVETGGAHRDVYRRHTMYRVADRMVPANFIMEAGPFVKYGDRAAVTEADLDAGISELDENPWGEALRPAFEAAHIEFGRADFGFENGKPAVYEINTNPAVGLGMQSRKPAMTEAVGRAMKALSDAVAALDGETRTAKLRHERKWYKRLDFNPLPRLRQP